jgi:hypothetical protein
MHACPAAEWEHAFLPIKRSPSARFKRSLQTRNLKIILPDPSLPPARAMFGSPPLRAVDSALPWKYSLEQEI